VKRNGIGIFISHSSGSRVSQPFQKKPPSDKTEAQPNAPLSVNTNFFALFLPLLLFLLPPHVFRRNPTISPPPPPLHGWQFCGRRPRCGARGGGAADGGQDLRAGAAVAVPEGAADAGGGDEAEGGGDEAEGEGEGEVQFAAAEAD